MDLFTLNFLIIFFVLLCAQVQELKGNQKEMKLLESEKSKNLLQIKSTKEQLRKQEENVEKLTSNLHNRDAENRSLKKVKVVLLHILIFFKATHFAVRVTKFLRFCV